MSEYAEIKRLINIMSERPLEQMFTAEVLSCSEVDCKVMLGTMELSGVKLFSVEAGGGFLIKPAVGSMVTIADLSKGLQRDLSIVKVDKAEQILIEIDGLKIDIDGVAKKIEISSNGITLKDLFTKIQHMIDALTKGVLVQGSTLAVVAPTVPLDLIDFETQFKTLLK
jgi:hypothetical protein